MFFFNDDFSNHKFDAMRNKMKHAEQMMNIGLMGIASVLAIVHIIREAIHGRFALSSILLLLLFIGLFILFIRKGIKEKKAKKRIEDEFDCEIDDEFEKEAIFDFSDNETDLEVEDHED